MSKNNNGVKFHTSERAAKNFEQLGMKQPERQCSTCAHVKVCTYIRNIVRVIKSEEGDMGRPFNPEDIAKICEFYAYKGSEGYGV